GGLDLRRSGEFGAILGCEIRLAVPVEISDRDEESAAVEAASSFVVVVGPEATVPSVEQNGKTVLPPAVVRGDDVRLAVGVQVAESERNGGKSSCGRVVMLGLKAAVAVIHEH